MKILRGRLLVNAVVAAVTVAAAIAQDESVNCSRKRQINFDVHMAFAEQKPPATPTDTQAEALECSSITAELIPRHRPDEWDIMGRMKKTKKPGALKGALKKIAAHDLHRPIRLTGRCSSTAPTACV